MNPGHMLGLSHSIVGIVLSSSSQDQAGSEDDATMAPTADATTNLRDLRYEDKASAIRTYTRVNGLGQSPANLATITGRIVRDPGCSVAATGVSVKALPISGGSNNLTAKQIMVRIFAKPDCNADPSHPSCGDGGGGGGGGGGKVCRPKSETELKCSDGKDDDCDLLIDAADPDCNGGACTPTEVDEVSCSDGVDNDCDGFVDADDSDCNSGGLFPASPDHADTFSDSEFRSPATPDGRFTLNVPSGGAYRIDVFTYNWYNQNSAFYSGRYNFTTINSNTVSLGNLFCGSGALLFPAEAAVPELAPGEVFDLGDVCVQSSTCTLGDPTP